MFEAKNLTFRDMQFLIELLQCAISDASLGISETGSLGALSEAIFDLEEEEREKVKEAEDLERKAREGSPFEARLREFEKNRGVE